MESEKDALRTGSAISEKTPAPDGAAPASLRESYGPANSPLSPEERKKAADIIDYFNLSNTILAEEPYTLPESCFAAVREYLQTWCLKPLPKVVKNAEAVLKRLVPPHQLFAKEMDVQFLRHIGDMNMALNEVLKEYRRLEIYVGDRNIVDDGVLGKKIIAALDVAYQKFLTSRNNFLKQMEDGEVSARAEDGLLRDHPLGRQIRLAREIFSLFRQTAFLLGEEHSARAALTQVGDNLKNALDDAGKPPFRASPGVEREYRAFLKEASRFAEILSRGLAGSFHASVRQSLNDATAASRRAYNDFVRAENRE
ncbi:MAG: hypothetical protein LBS77_06535 [Desulfovibrio sp.]|nr:hypothetical protein [Desulfovibrio sp.]